MPFLILKMVGPSAKSTVELGGRGLGGLFVMVEKRVRRRTEPCGTPEEGRQEKSRSWQHKLRT